MRQLTVFFLTVAFAACISACSKSDTSVNPVPNTGDSTTMSATSIAAADEPDVNSASVESVWSTATAMTTTVSKIGQNFVGADRHFPVSIKSLVSGENIFFLVQYDDPTESYLRIPLAFTGKDPSNQKNWAQIPTYDDGVSFFFEQIPGTSDAGNLSFKTNGCAMLCHTDHSISDPGMFSEDSGKYDVWYWHSGKSNADGYAEDNISIGNPIFAMIKDDPNADDFLNNMLQLDSGYLPYKVSGGNNDGLDQSKFISAKTSVGFNPTSPNPATGAAWKTGDRVPAYLIGTPVVGNDYYDVQSRGFYSNGKWTVKFKRALSTSSGHLDIGFTHGGTYQFSFAVHDATPPDNHYGVANQPFTLNIP